MTTFFALPGSWAYPKPHVPDAVAKSLWPVDEVLESDPISLPEPDSA